MKILVAGFRIEGGKVVKAAAVASNRSFDRRYLRRSTSFSAIARVSASNAVSSAA